MAKVLLGVTGSVAAIRTPELVVGCGQAARRENRTRGASLLRRGRLPVTRRGGVCSFQESFFGDEWPGRGEGRRYRRDDPVLHIELRRWADVLVIAPLDANTLAKLAAGLADNCLTCVWRAWDPARPVVLAPAMNTLMWQHPLTARHLRQLLAEEPEPPPGVEPDIVLEWINRTQKKLRIVSPQSKRLACGDVGIGAMAEVGEIVQVVESTK